MNADWAPLGRFLMRADAEAAQAWLRALGIESVIRNADDPPPGWRPNHGELGVNLWVAKERLDEAENTLRKGAPASPPFICEKCGRQPATVHLTFIRDDGTQTCHQLCEQCHASSEKAPRG